VEHVAKLGQKIFQEWSENFQNKKTGEKFVLSEHHHFGRLEASEN